MERYIGLDVGYGFVKVTDGDNGYAFPSVVGEGDLTPSLVTGYHKSQRVADLRIGIHGKVYFVGKLAIRRSSLAYRGLSATRSEGEDLRVLVLSALSLFCNEPTNRFDVVTGLPPGRMHLREELISQLGSHHRVTVVRDRRIQDIDITINRIEVVPQPLGTFWAETLDSWGQVRNPLYGKVGIVDIGFKTTDLAAIEDGEFIPEKTRTIPVGLSSAYSDLSDKLLVEHGLEKETYALDEAFIRGTVNVAGRPVDITGLRDKTYESLATKLLVELMSTWQVPEFDKSLISGGGGAALGKYILPHLPQGEMVSEPVTANSIGFLNWANRLWRVNLEADSE
ncbi:MAG TPA: ParM/StbA family protein [Bacillota bacterium]|nr:ParM/StbA family protein [Bacillota bacterium]